MLEHLPSRRCTLTKADWGLEASPLPRNRWSEPDLTPRRTAAVRGRAIAEAAGSRAYYFHCDVSRRDEVDKAFDAAVGALGGLDAIIHAAAIEITGPAEDMDEAEWDRLFAINARGTLNTNQAAFRHWREQGQGGHIINFASSAGVIGMPGGAGYSATKAAVLGWTRTAAKEWGRYDIRVNAICPAMWTPMYDAHRAAFSERELAEHDQMMRMIIPIGGKLGDPEADLVPFLLFMVSDGSRFITGQTLAVDGGMMIP